MKWIEKYEYFDNKSFYVIHFKYLIAISAYIWKDFPYFGSKHNFLLIFLTESIMHVKLLI